MLNQEKKIQDIFVARQPIFDRYQKIYGYELLFRSGLENFFDQGLDIDFASSKTLLDTLLLFGIDQLTQGKKMFLNFSKKVLLSEVAFALPKEQLIIELLETIQPEPEVIAVCKKLKKNGYILALDDFQYVPDYQPLIDLAHIIKVDFQLTQGHERKELIQRNRNKKIKYLAEKIESYEEYKEAVNIGYSYFQGFFFCRPSIVSGKDVPSYKLNLFQALQELNQSYMDVKKIEEIILRDVSLSYKLLRFINSAAFGIPGEIRSIRQALLLLGIVEIKKWMSLIVLSQIGSDSPEELLVNSIVRAKFCETIADQTKLKHRKYDFFIMGLFSFIDIFLNRSMAEILAELPIAADIKEALLGIPNDLRPVLDLIIMYEQGKWDSVAEISHKLELGSGKILANYLAAIKWANDCSRIKT
ncbi:MAG TPA: HDOD domain-containing protein [Candidatus Deferrimicrobium sp.]|nr:HDOD domain-containing protein [Candidatus Deferrimicrobium sp.]